MSEYVYKRESICDGVYSAESTGEQIVRCRDCRFRCFDECTRIDEGFKDYWFAIEPDGFCKWGERKAEER